MATSSLPLQGWTVALLEGRQQEELARLLEKEGARPWPCPLVQIVEAPDRAAVVAWLRDLADGQFSWLLLLTGEAWRRLVKVATEEGLREAVLAGAARTRIVCRGPKPVQALREVGLAPSLTVHPPTTAGLLATLRNQDLRGQVVALTRYGQVNEPLETFLTQAGAQPRPVLPYLYAPAAPDDQVVALIHQLHAGAIQALFFTSAPQVERLQQVATLHGLEEVLRQGLRRTCVAAIGPVAAEALRQRGWPVTLCPEQGFVMKNLVQLLKRYRLQAPSGTALEGT
jgi:uroporphyrinogen-III synthase